MREDVEKLKKYLEGHHDRLSIDIGNSKKKGDADNVNFYKGAQGATHLFITLVDDILKKHE